MHSSVFLGLLALAVAAAPAPGPARSKAILTAKQSEPPPPPPPPPLQPAAPPALKEPVRVVEAYAPREPEAPIAGAPGASAVKPSKLRLTPKAGVAFTSESATDPVTPGFAFGAALEYSFSPAIVLGADFRDLWYRRTYLGPGPDLAAQAASRTSLDEQKVGADILLELEVLRLLEVPVERPRLAVLIGPFFRFFHNVAFRSSVGAIAAGLATGWVFNEQLDVRAGGVYAHNLFFKNDALLSALGGPKSVSSTFGSVGLRPAPEVRLGVGYEGELLVMESSTRLYHSLAFSFELELL